MHEDDLRTPPPTRDYDVGHDRIWGKKRRCGMYIWLGMVPIVLYVVSVIWLFVECGCMQSPGGY